MIKCKNTPPPRNSNCLLPRHYASLDGLRAYAAIGIILMHVLSNIPVKPTRNFVTESLIPFFSDFVLLFMVVSGFSLCCGYYKRIKEGIMTPDAFYKKRYLRILPFFAFLCLLDFSLEPGMETFYQVYANVTLCFGLLPDHNITVIGLGWFLGIVFLFYMLFPFFVFLLNNRRRAWLMLLAALFFVFTAMNGNFVKGDMGRGNFIFCAPLFLSGGIVYLYREEIACFIRRNSVVCPLATVALTICWFCFKDMIESRYAAYFAELCLFVLWLVYAIGSSGHLLNNRMAKYLSGISMEIYLAHMVIFRIVEKAHLENFIHQCDLLYIVTSLLTICGVVCFAHIMKYYIFDRIESRLGK